MQTQSQVPPQSPVVQGRSARPGWWRRNIFGVLLLVPALVLTAVEPVISNYETLWTRRERVPAQVAEGAWASYGGVRVRLVEVAEEKDLPAYGGQRKPAPTGMRVVRVVLAFEGPGTALSLCKLTLLSTTGDEYAARPDELSGASLGYDPCSVEEAIEPVDQVGTSTSASPSATATQAVANPTPSVDPSANHQWRTETYFVMPLDAYPGKVHLSLSTLLPDYLVLN